MLFTADWFKDAATRAARSFAQTLAAALGGSALNVWNAGWHQSLGLAAGSAVLAILMAIDRATVSVAAPIVQALAPALVSPASTVTACGDSLR